MNKTLFATLILAAAAAAAGWFWIGTGEEPVATEVPTAQSGAEPPTAQAGAPLADVVIPEALSAQAQLGETYFNAVCASCHGVNAAGQDGVAPPLVHRIYEPSHHGDMAFVMAAKNGVRAHHWRFGNMPPVEQSLTNAELGAIVAYVRELQRANGIK